MTRKCSYCSHNGHNSRTCTNKGVKIFGVRLTDESIRKSVSLGNLNGFAAGIHDSPEIPAGDGYASEDFVAGSSSSPIRGRKKGVAWTEEEHRMFLLGLHKLGKGDWRGISKNYVISRTPTQVASHAQKYFIRQANLSKRKRRSSLFDIIPNDETGIDKATNPKTDTQNNNTVQISVPIVVSSPPEQVVVERGEPSFYPFLFPAFVPYPVPIWYGPDRTYPEAHQVVKPLAVHSKELINVDELVEMSKLNIDETGGRGGDPFLSLKLSDGSSRQSAFHANSSPGPGKSNVGSDSNAIHAV